MSWILFEEIHRSHSQNCTYERSLYTTVKMIPIKHFKLERELCGSLRSRRIKGRGWGRRERIRGKKHILLHPLPYSAVPSAVRSQTLPSHLRKDLHFCLRGLFIQGIFSSLFKLEFFYLLDNWLYAAICRSQGRAGGFISHYRWTKIVGGPKWTMQIRRSTELLSHVYSVFRHYFVNYVSDKTNKRLL